MKRKDFGVHTKYVEETNTKLFRIGIKICVVMTAALSPVKNSSEFGLNLNYIGGFNNNNKTIINFRL